MGDGDEWGLTFFDSFECGGMGMNTRGGIISEVSRNMSYLHSVTETNSLHFQKQGKTLPKLILRCLLHYCVHTGHSPG